MPRLFIETSTMTIALKRPIRFSVCMKRRTSLFFGVRLIAIMLLVLGGTSVSGEEASVARSATRPESKKDRLWVQKLMEQQHALTNQPGRVCLIGDSLTEFWTSTGQQSWERHFSLWKTLNLGISADRTEHILARLQRLDFHRAKVKVIVLMMGTNNLGMTSPDEPSQVVAVTVLAVELLREKFPKTQVIVLGLPPSGNQPTSPLRDAIKDTNKRLAAHTWPSGVVFLPIYDHFVDAGGRWVQGHTLDGTHFSPLGYAAFAEVLAPILQKTLLEGSNTP